MQYDKSNENYTLLNYLVNPWNYLVNLIGILNEENCLVVMKIFTSFFVTILFDKLSKLPLHVLQFNLQLNLALETLEHGVKYIQS